MRDLNDEDNYYDYSPNELANLSVNNKEKYERIVKSNLNEGDTVHKWEQRNLEWAKECLREQRANKK